MEAYAGSRGTLRSFLTSEMDKDDGQLHGPAALPRKTTQAPTNKRLRGPQRRYKRFGKEKKNAGLTNKS